MSASDSGGLISGRRLGLMIGHDPAGADTLAVDGKSTRGSRHGEVRAAHLLAGFTSAGLTVTQLRVLGKANERRSSKPPNQRAVPGGPAPFHVRRPRERPPHEAPVPPPEDAVRRLEKLGFAVADEARGETRTDHGWARLLPRRGAFSALPRFLILAVDTLRTS
ncbi:hypothetical protein [Streptomyces sp. NPDC058874]|uniref:hypothetical protein n=1 Tax=unclassified Streptomyces TaxID=2593676 RepID=UPI0036B96D8E